MTDVATGTVPQSITLEEKPRGGVVVVALPAESDPIHAASSEQPSAHMTLAFLGDISELDGKNVSVDDLVANVEQWAAKIDGPITEGVAGTAVLGADKAQVVLIDATSFAQIVDGMTHEFAEGAGEGVELETGADEQSPIAKAWSQTEQFPVWTPHVTLGYPEAPPTGEFARDRVDFDRIALWAGGDHFEFPLGVAPQETPDQDPIVAAAVVADTPVDEVSEAPVDVGADDEGDDDSIDELFEIPFHGVAAPVDRPTGDQRLFRGEGLSFDERVIMRWAAEDWGAHAGAKRVGRVTDIWIEDGLIKYQGFFSAGLTEVNDIIAGLADGTLGGVSVDVDDVIREAPAANEIVIPQDATPEEMSAALQQAMNPELEVYSQARVRGITIVDIPAFVEAYIALGECDCPDEVAEHDEADDTPPDLELTDEEAAEFANYLTEDSELLEFAKAAVADLPEDALWTERAPLIAAAAFAPGTHDGPGWITAPVATSRIRRYWVSGKGAGKIRWGEPGDFNRCRSQLAKYVHNPDHLAGLCANMHKERLGVWPGQEGGGRRAGLVASGAKPSRPSVVIVAAGYGTDDVPPRSWFENPNLPGPTPMTITREGHVFGHVAQWDVCHMGAQGVCTVAPRSVTDYAYFHLGLAETDGGDVEVGHITLNTGHAGLRDASRAAAAHYDNTGSVVADIAVGEDEFGIWFSGALRPGTTDSQRRELKAAKISGDWRDFGNGDNLDLVAALAVNVPGFATPRRAIAASGGRQTALVAAGIVERAEPTADELATIARGNRIALARQAAAFAIRQDRIRRIRLENP